MNYLDDKTIYVFVRGDLQEEAQVVQASHAVFSVAWSTSLADQGEGGEPRIVVLDGGSSEKAFAKTLRKLKESGVWHFAYIDPDHQENGVTAIATGALTKEEALPLANYRLRRYSPPSATSAEVALDGQRGANSNASVAQETEHSVSNREVAGSIPAVSLQELPR